MTSQDFCHRLILAGALIATLGLAGCGRKGDLDLPPSASAQPAPVVETQPVSPANAILGGNSSAPPREGFGPNGEPVAPKGAKQPFILDPLLN